MTADPHASLWKPQPLEQSSSGTVTSPVTHWLVCPHQPHRSDESRPPHAAQVVELLQRSEGNTASPPPVLLLLLLLNELASAPVLLASSTTPAPAASEAGPLLSAPVLLSMTELPPALL